MTKQTFSPAVEEINQTFCNEVRHRGGRISEQVLGQDALYVRAILNLSQDVFPRDKIDAGIAMRVYGPGLAIHPYTFRQVCRNGAIAATSSWSLAIERHDQEDAFEDQRVVQEVRETVAVLCGEKPFAECLIEMRQSDEVRINSLSMIISLLKHLDLDDEDAEEIIQQFFGHERQSGFGLLNAVTAVARRKRHQERKWRLETAGARVPALLHLYARSGHEDSRVENRLAQPVG